MKRSICATFVGLVIGFLLVNVSAAQKTDSPAAKRISEFVSFINEPAEKSSQSFFIDNFEKSDDATVARRQVQTERLRKEFGNLEFQKVVESGKHQVTSHYVSSNGPSLMLTVAVSDEPPHKISEIRLSVGEPDETLTSSKFDPAVIDDVIATLGSELRSKYVFPDVGEDMANAVEESLDAGDYNEVNGWHELASKLTDQLRDICRDKHLRVRAGSLRRPESGLPKRQVSNHGFKKVEMLPGGIGYVKFDFFSGDKAAESTAAAAMNFLAQSKAIIFDVRENGGGSPEMIAFLTSYFYDEPIHLNSFYNRPTDTTTETWTRKDVPGQKFGSDVPVYVLTSGYTFSGAEEFSYNFKNLKRATLVGETTGGGAHPVMPVSLGDHVHMTMPFARAINPISKTNWEGVGVKPDVEIESENALEKAIKLARKAIKNADQNPVAKSDSTDLRSLVNKAQNLMAENSYQEAAKVFEKITAADSENAMAWLHFGYCLHMVGDLPAAIKIHNKAANFDQTAPIATYNVACAYSLMNKPDKAIENLQAAIDLGFGDYQQLQGDSDLNNIRKDDRFIAILKSLQGQ